MDYHFYHVQFLASEYLRLKILAIWDIRSFLKSVSMSATDWLKRHVSKTTHDMGHRFSQAQFPLAELTGDRFPLPVNTARQLG